jgi:hypothetical protein
MESALVVSCLEALILGGLLVYLVVLKRDLDQQLDSTVEQIRSLANRIASSELGVKSLQAKTPADEKIVALEQKVSALQLRSR